MRWPLASSSAIGRRRRCDQSRSAAACSATGASASGSERCTSSAHAASRSDCAPSSRTRSCSRWRCTSQPDTSAKAASTATTVSQMRKYSDLTKSPSARGAPR